MNNRYEPFLLPGAINLVFADGDFVSQWPEELAPGASLTLREAPAEDEAMGIVLRLDRGVELDRPVHVAQIATRHGLPEQRLMLEHECIASPESHVTFIESHHSLEGVVQASSARCRLRLGERARVVHLKVRQRGHCGTLESTSFVSQEANSHYLSHEINLSGEETRREIVATLNGAGACCELLGLSLARRRQRMSARTRVVHNQPACETIELYKAIAGDYAEMSFDGLIRVERNAQQARAQQTNRNLLLSNGARMKSIPRLEIYADDVRCCHGSTTGELDEEQIFYLRTRGFAPEIARAFLVYAFASEVLEMLPFAPLRERLATELLTLLPGGQAIGEAA